MTLNQLKQSAQSLINARKAATNKEWYECGCRYTFISCDQTNNEIQDIAEFNVGTIGEQEMEANKRFVCLAANHSAQIAEKLLKCITALEIIAENSAETLSTVGSDCLEEITKE